MLQNRVDPLGNLIRTPARGAWMGNRGLLHNDKQTIVRPFKLLAWITCQLEWKGWHRPIMAPGQYTELFFFDEATAFAAGHRPCFECRREDATRFKTAWIAGNPAYGFHAKTPIGQIDAIMHEERMDKQMQKRIHEVPTDQLSDGTFVIIDNNPWLVKGRHLHLWTPFGYEQERAMPSAATIAVLTPPSIINAFRAGYRPQIII